MVGNAVDWSYFDKFNWADERYLPDRGEGETMATQIVTAVTKLVYKWYNDGDVFDNQYRLCGWCNDLSSYANWLIANVPEKASALNRISEICTYGEYEMLLKDLVDATHDEKYLEEMNKKPKIGSIYECDGPFAFVDYEEEFDEEWEMDEEDDEYDD